MAGIQDYLNSIKNAIYGKDVRQAIHDGILQCYLDSSGEHYRVLDYTKVNQPLDKNNQPTNGTNGQILRTNGDGSTEWSDVGLPTDEQTAQAVFGWLDDHPEATTTVLDGSLTEEKLQNPLFRKVAKKSDSSVFDGSLSDTDKCIRDMSVSGVSTAQIVGSNNVYERVDINSSNYGVFVGETTSEVESSNVSIKDSKIVSAKGNRSRENVNSEGENVSFINNDIETTGTTDDAVGIELWTADSKAIANHIYKNGKTGHSGITSGRSRNIIALNNIDGFAGGIELSYDNNLVVGNIIRDSAVGIYHAAPIGKENAIYDCIIKNCDKGIYCKGNTVEHISNCIISSDTLLTSSDNAGIHIQATSGDQATREIIIDNCYIKNYKYAIRVDSTNIHVFVNNCVFELDTYQSIYVGNNQVTFNNCKFIRCAPYLPNSGEYYLNNCVFTEYTTIPFARQSGGTEGNQFIHLNNCKFDLISDVYYPFSLPMTTANRYRAGYIDGRFITYNYNKDYILANYADKLLGGMICYDVYLNKTYIYNGTTLVEVTA